MRTGAVGGRGTGGRETGDTGETVRRVSALGRGREREESDDKVSIEEEGERDDMGGRADRGGRGGRGGRAGSVSIPAFALATASIIEAPPSVNCCVPTTEITS